MLRFDLQAITTRGVLKTVTLTLTRYLTFDPNDLDLSKNEPLKGNFGVNLHAPTKFGEGRRQGLGGVGEQTDKQTNVAQIIV